MQFPSKSTKAPVGKSLACNLHQFQKLGCMSVELDLKRLDDGDVGMVRGALLQPTMLDGIKHTKIDRKIQRRSTAEQKASSLSAVHTRSSHGKADFTEHT